MKYYKVLNETERHHGLQFKTGLNIDSLPFNGSGYCKPGGIYFASENILEFIGYGPFIRQVILPDGARVYTEKTGNIVKYKADKVILRRKRKINSAMIISLLDEGALAPHDLNAIDRIIDKGIWEKNIHLFKHPKLINVIRYAGISWEQVLYTKDVIFIEQMLRTFKPNAEQFDNVNILEYPKVLRRLIVEEVK